MADITLNGGAPGQNQAAALSSVPGPKPTLSAQDLGALFAPGDVVSGRVVQSLGADQYLLAMRGANVVVASQSELRPDSVVRFQVVATGAQVQLRMLDGSAEDQAQTSTSASRLQALGLPPGSASALALSAFEDAGAPLSRAPLLAAAATLAGQAAGSATSASAAALAAALAALARDDLPATPATISVALRALAAALPAAGATLAPVQQAAAALLALLAPASAVAVPAARPGTAATAGGGEPEPSGASTLPLTTAAPAGAPAAGTPAGYPPAPASAPPTAAQTDASARPIALPLTAESPLPAAPAAPAPAAPPASTAAADSGRAAPAPALAGAGAGPPAALPGSPAATADTARVPSPAAAPSPLPTAPAGSAPAATVAMASATMAAVATAAAAAADQGAPAGAGSTAAASALPTVSTTPGGGATPVSTLGALRAILTLSVPDATLDGAPAVMQALALAGVRSSAASGPLTTLLKHLAAALPAAPPPGTVAPAGSAAAAASALTLALVHAVREGSASSVIKPAALADYDQVLGVPLQDQGAAVPTRLAVATRPAAGGTATYLRVDTELSHLGAVSVRLSGIADGPMVITLLADGGGARALAAALPALAQGLQERGLNAGLRVASLAGEDGHG